MIISNIWIQAGLVNGATGVIRHIIFEKNSVPPHLPLAVVVEMDLPYNGPSLPGKPRYSFVFQISIL